MRRSWAVLTVAGVLGCSMASQYGPHPAAEGTTVQVMNRSGIAYRLYQDNLYLGRVSGAGQTCIRLHPTRGDVTLLVRPVSGSAIATAPFRPTESTGWQLDLDPIYGNSTGVTMRPGAACL